MELAAIVAVALVLIAGQTTKHIEKIYRFQPWANVTYIRNVRGSSPAIPPGSVVIRFRRSGASIPFSLFLFPSAGKPILLAGSSDVVPTIPLVI
jgi:hypothetical protein